MADISDPGTPAPLVAATVEVFGTIDIVIANAGGPPPARALDVDDEYSTALNANLLSAVRLTRAAVPFMRKRMGTDLLHHLLLGGAADPHSGAVQHGPVRTVGVGEDRGPGPRRRGDRYHPQPVCPGPHATDRMRELGGRGHGGSGRLRQLRPFLLRQANFINGAALVVDGGLTLAL